MTLQDSVTHQSINGGDTSKGAVVINASKSAADATKPDNNIAVYFDTITDHNITIQNQVTNNWLENNTAVQDGIAKEPLKISLSGVSGELVYVPSMNSKERFLRNIYENINDQLRGNFDSSPLKDYVATDKLTVIPQLLPPVDNVTQAAKNLLTQVEDNIDRYRKIAANFLKKVNDNQTRLQEIYTKLKTLRDSDTALIIQTPFGTFNNMYIQSIGLAQPNQNHIVNISMTLMQMNFTDVEVTEPDKDVLSKYNAVMRAQVQDHGVVSGKTVDSRTLLKTFVNRFS